jgi:hypothetical protein
MSRVTIVVNKDLLAACIKEAEANGPLANQSAVQQKVSELYNAKKDVSLKEISPSVVYLRIKEFGLVLTTPKGKRGKVAGCSPVGFGGTGKRTPKAEKFAADPKVVKMFQELYKVVPERFQPVLEKARKGSRNAAVKLMCLSCVNYETGEVGRCTVICPLWPFRPYKSKGDAAVDADPNAVVEIEEVPEVEETEEAEV